MVSDDGTSNSNDLGADVDEKVGGLARIVGDIFSSDSAMTKSSKSNADFKPKGMFLGSRRDNAKPIDIPPQVLARHAAMLGSTGSGKTVMAKALIEEAAIAKIPSLIIDPQGDLARLALGIDEKDLTAQGGDVSRARKLLDMCEVRIWTPLRSKGLPLCIDPFRAPPADLDPEEAITAWDMVAAGFTSLAGFDVEKAQGKVIKPFLYEILVEGTKLGVDVGDFRSLAKVVREPHHEFIRQLYPQCFVEEDEDGKMDVPTWEEVMMEFGLADFEERLPKSTRNDLARRLSAFSSGVNQLLFSNGVPIDIDSFVEPAIPGKIPLNIVYLNTIQDEAQKQYFVQELSRELYDWMLTQQPAEGELKLLFFMDEVAPYLPPHPRNPPAKDLIKLIFKQARKYGVACVLATQNVSDVDYKILAQANTTFIGRFTQPQDVEKVRHLLKESGGDQDLVAQLPTLGPGQFQMVAPDVDPAPVPIQCRWLYNRTLFDNTGDFDLSITQTSASIVSNVETIQMGDLGATLNTTFTLDASVLQSDVTALTTDSDLFGYSIIENDALPLTDYFAFVDLKTISETKTGVAYQSNFKATGDNNEEMTGMITQLYNSIIDGIVATG